MGETDTTNQDNVESAVIQLGKQIGEHDPSVTHRH